MQPDLSRWEDPASYDYLDDLPVSGLAWECLRRNRDYQEDYRAGLQADPDRNRDRLLRRWGLQFPHTTEPFGPRGVGALVGASRYQRRLPDVRPGGPA